MKMPLKLPRNFHFNKINSSLVIYDRFLIRKILRKTLLKQFPPKVKKQI